MRTPKVVNSFVCCDGLVVVHEYSDGVCRNQFDQNWFVKRQWLSEARQRNSRWKAGLERLNNWEEIGLRKQRAAVAEYEATGTNAYCNQLASMLGPINLRKEAAGNADTTER